MNAARRLGLATLTALCAFAGVLLFASAPVLAKEVHVFGSSFGSEGSGPGQFKEPLGIAVNDTTHDVYVVDSVNNRVEEFNSTGSAVIGEFNGSAAPTGTFSDPTQIAVDNSGNPLQDPSAGDVYVVDRGHDVIDKFSAEGAYIGQLTGTPNGEFPQVEGVAVDPNGVVWAVAFADPIYSFSDALENQYRSEITNPFGGIYQGSLAVDSEDNIYVYEGWIAKLDSSGRILANPFADDESFGNHREYAVAPAVDSKSGEVYIDSFDKGQATIGAYSSIGAPIERFGTGSRVSLGVAVDASNGTVYATSEADDVSIFDALLLPSVSIGAVTEQQPRSLTLNGTVNPEGLPVTSCEFEYVAAIEYEPGAQNPYAKGISVPCEPSPGDGSAAVPVKAEVKDLTPGTVYHYRLVAENTAHVSSPTPDEELTAGPVLGSEWVSDVASSSATLQAQVDPNGGDTHYYFQYGTTTAYGVDMPTSAPGVDIGSVEGQQTPTLHLQNLEADTIYHYRFVVVQGGETFDEPDRMFKTQSFGGELLLPDGRAWELVSPPNKNGALIEPQFGDVQAASGGDAISYLTTPPVGENPIGNGAGLSQVLSAHTQAGWRTEDITVPGAYPEEGEDAAILSGAVEEYRLFSPELSAAVVDPQISAVPLSSEATERTLYLRNDANGDFTPLVTPVNVPSGIKFGGTSGGITGSSNETVDTFMYFLGASPDLSHVVLASALALTPEAISEVTGRGGDNDHWNLYEWSAGQLQLVNVLPDGKPRARATLGRRYGFSGGPEQMTAHTVSNDGRWVVWSSEDEDGRKPALYVRDMLEEKTVQVGGESALFETMSGNGGRIFFLEDGDLYEFDTETDSQTDLTTSYGAGETTADVQDAVMGSSEDGSYVYFVAKGDLAKGAVGGEDNLYVSHYTGSEWVITYIATLSSEDEKSWFWGENFGTRSLVDSRVSPDGRYVAFMSDRSLTNYDNVDAVGGHPDEEVYLYDAESGKLVCASCDPTGARPVGVRDEQEGGSSNLLVDRNQTWTEGAPVNKALDHWLAGSVRGWDKAGSLILYQPRYLSDNGRLFFDSPDALVPQDTNGLEDVYEFEPAGVGSCTSASVTFGERSGGCVSLISSGNSSGESAFLDASENGDDVFFTTSSRLTAEDYDTSYDVYDAHVCSGSLPCQVLPVPSPACTSGDSCKAAPSPQPEIFGAAPSATFSGTGNVVEEKGSIIKSKPKVKIKKKAKARKPSKQKKSKQGDKGRKARRKLRSRASEKGGRR